MIKDLKESFDPKAILPIFLFVILASFIGTAIHSAVFPHEKIVSQETEISSCVKIDAFSLGALKTWNNLNPGEMRIDFDSCSYANRKSSNSFEVVLGDC